MLNRSLLCSNYHSAQTPIKSRDFFFIRKRRLTAAKAFAFGVVLMACSLAMAQDPGQGGNFQINVDLGVPSNSAAVLAGNQAWMSATSSGAPLIPSVIDGNPTPGGGADDSARSGSALLGAMVGMYVGWSKQGLRNGWDNFTHAEEGHLAPLQYFMGGPGDVEEGGAALGSGMRFGGPNGGGGGGWGRGWGYKTPALSALKNKAFYVGSFNDNLSLWEMQNFGSQWGVNAGIPGRHLLGLVDRIGLGLKGPGYGAAVERINQAFWQEGLSIQNAIRREPKILALFQAEAEQDADFYIEMGESEWEQREAYKHYEKHGLHAFDNP
jgi:hypothetical protein